MRIHSDYKDYKTKEENNINLELLAMFLDEYTVDVDCGDTFDRIYFLFLNHAPVKRLEKEKKLYESYAIVEIKSEFMSAGEINIQEFLEAFYLITRAIHRVERIQVKSMDFQLESLVLALNRAEKNLFSSNRELEEYKKKRKEIRRNNRVREVNLHIKKDRECVRELTKRISGVGVKFTLQESGFTLAPYAFQYDTIFSNLLVKEGIMLPGYSEIIIEINKSLDEAKAEAGYPEHWGKSTFAAIDIEKYETANEEEKSQMVLESICQGLRYIAEFDHLDIKAIERVLEIVKREGTGMELVYREKENEQYSAQVVYHVTDAPGDDALFCLKLREKATGKERYVELGNADLWFGPQISGIRLTKKEVVIEGRKSFTADIRRDMNSIKESYRFKIEELL